MPIAIACPECQKKLRVADKHAGKRVRCPACQGVIEVPAAQPAAAPPVAKAPPPKRSAPPARWYVHSHDGQQYGPVDKGELDGWLAEGLITAECQLCQEGTEQWQPSTTLYPQLAAAAPAPRAGGGSSAYDGESFHPAAVARLPAMQLDRKREKILNAVQRTLNLECPKLGCQIAGATGFEVGPGPQGWVNQMNAKGVHIPLLEFGSSDINVDFLSAFEIAHPEGEFLAVFPRENMATYATQFATVMPGSLPNSIALERVPSGKKAGFWNSFYEDDPLCAAASQDGALGYDVRWDWQMHMPGMVSTIRLPWTIQATPLGEEHFLFMAQTPMGGGAFISNFRVGWFLERRRAFAHFVAHCGGGEGDYEADFMFPTDAILPLSIKYGEALAQAHQFE